MPDFYTEEIDFRPPNEPIGNNPHYCATCSAWLWPNRVAGHLEACHVVLTGPEARQQAARMKLLRVLEAHDCVEVGGDYDRLMARKEAL